MNIYIDANTDRVIRYSGGRTPPPEVNHRFKVQGKDYVVSNVEQRKKVYKFMSDEIDYIIHCHEILLFDKEKISAEGRKLLNELSLEIEKHSEPAHTEFLKGFKFSPDGKGQTYEIDGRIWHRTLKDDCNWTSWVEYV
ncbi:hypothetical protein KNT87_gp173 [Erwinia phage Cronus]|uniref:Uncharacterized protein n=1 Tax=Erwinia phage Cronus TaxID=2163633 RepID=A0A2S1GLY6_9CAUD|nr:hypothetical protein KNT87_gp173 [Erwinia phage Cronus]AWD90396.1 hypothetical protein [Erwinia phage Cronus]